MTRFILFIWALTVPISAAPVTRSMDLNMSTDNSTLTLIEKVQAIAESHDFAMKVAILSAFIAVLSAILIACLMVGLFVKTTKKMREIAKLLERDNSVNKDLESGLREEMKPDKETVKSDESQMKPNEVVKLQSQIYLKPNLVKNYHKQRLLMKLKESQKEHPLAKITSMEKVSQRKRRRRPLRSRNERNKGTSLKIYPAMDVSDTELSPGELVKRHYPFPKHQKNSPYEFKESDSVSLSFGEEKLDNETSGHEMDENSRDPRKMELYADKGTSPTLTPSKTAKKSFKKPSRRPPPKHKIKNQEFQSEAERVLANLDEIMPPHPVTIRSELTTANRLSSARERRLAEKRKTDQAVPNTATGETLKIEKIVDSLCIEVEKDDVISSPPTILPPNPFSVTPVLPKECTHKLSPKQVTLAPPTSQLNNLNVRRPEAKSTLTTARRQEPRNKNAPLETQTPPPKHDGIWMMHPFKGH